MLQSERGIDSVKFTMSDQKPTQSNPKPEPVKTEPPPNKDFGKSSDGKRPTKNG